MPLPFLGRFSRRKPAASQQLRVSLAPDQLESEGQSIRLQYHSRSSHGVRLPATHDVAIRLPSLLEGFAIGQVELIEPLPLEFQDAMPTILRPENALHWINVHYGRSPVARHALLIFESLNAIDLAYETFAVALLHGEVDGEGFPRFDAIVGGPVSYWDETTGELIVRLVLGWGGEGVRGDTERTAQRLLTRLMINLMASQGATELGRVERPVAITDSRHSACPHCGFPAVDRRAAYCAKCGMRTRA
jgi:ribosomal protein L37E